MNKYLIRPVDPDLENVLLSFLSSPPSTIKYYAEFSHYSNKRIEKNTNG